MSGAGLRRRALAAAVFGAAAGFSLWITLVLVRWFFFPVAEGDAAGVVALVYFVVLVAVLPAAAVGWLRAEAFGAPAPPGRADWDPDVLRGLGVTVRAFLVGCALFAVWPDAHDASALREGMWVSVVSGYVRDFLATVLFGAVLVGPFALLSGGAAGWVVGRALGTAAPPAR